MGLLASLRERREAAAMFSGLARDLRALEPEMLAKGVPVELQGDAKHLAERLEESTGDLRRGVVFAFLAPILVLLAIVFAGLLAGCGGGGDSSSTDCVDSAGRVRPPEACMRCDEAVEVCK